MHHNRWVRILGDGCIYKGSCQVYAIILQVDAVNDVALIYDGIDAVSGKLFCELATSVDITRELCLHEGVSFEAGIYIDATDEAVATTVVFEPG